MINIGVHLIVCSNRLEIYQQIITTLILSWVPCPLCLYQGTDGVGLRVTALKELLRNTSLLLLHGLVCGQKGRKRREIAPSYSKHGSESWAYLGAC